MRSIIDDIVEMYDYNIDFYKNECIDSPEDFNDESYWNYLWFIQEQQFNDFLDLFKNSDYRDTFMLIKDDEIHERGDLLHVLDGAEEIYTDQYNVIVCKRWGSYILKYNVEDFDLIYCIHDYSDKTYIKLFCRSVKRFVEQNL